MVGASTVSEHNTGNHKTIKRLFDSEYNYDQKNELSF